MRKALPYIAPHNHQVDDLLCDLPRDQLADVARFFGTIQDTLERHAAHHKAQQERQARAEHDIAELQSLGALITALLSQGRSFDDVLRQLEAQGMNRDTVRTYWRKHQKIEKRAHRIGRNRLIMRLWQSGWGDRQIALRVSLHPKYINRIIQRQRRLLALTPTVVAPDPYWTVQQRVGALLAELPAQMPSRASGDD